MKRTTTIIASVFIFLTTLALTLPTKAFALVILPALILIPIAKVVAAVVAFLSVPLIGLGVSLKKIKKLPIKKIISYLLLLLLGVILLTVIYLKLSSPERAWF